MTVAVLIGAGIVAYLAVVWRWRVIRELRAIRSILERMRGGRNG